MKPAHEVTYDGEADALYIGLATEFVGRVSTIPSPDDAVQVDVVDGKMVGLEVLAASKHPLFAALVPKTSGALTLTHYQVGAS